MEYASPFGEKTIIQAHCSVKQASFRKCTTIALLTTRICIKGFLNGGTHTLSEEERKAKVILQLTKLFGAEAEIM
jgi:monoamine oxidase